MIKKSMFKKIVFLLVILVVLGGVTGCIKVKKQGTATVGNLGGVFISPDRMETWTHRSLLMTPGENIGSIGNVNAYFIKFDPIDPDYVFLGTQQNGLFYSYNGGAGWIPVKGLQENSFIRDFAVDPIHKCRSYAARGSTLYRSEDCLRTWTDVYYTNNVSHYVSSVAVDWFDNRIVWVGLSDGSLFRSDDYGMSWRPMNTFPNRVRKIIVDPFDSRSVFVGVSQSGLYKTENKGETWFKLNDGMKDFRGHETYFDFTVSGGSENLVLYVSRFGLVRSLDGGVTWNKVDILSNSSEEQIFSIAIDNKNPNNIYYATSRALYKTFDGGGNWIVTRTPTSRTPRVLAVHPSEERRVYMGVFQQEK